MNRIYFHFSQVEQEEKCSYTIHISLVHILPISFIFVFDKIVSFQNLVSYRIIHETNITSIQILSKTKMNEIGKICTKETPLVKLYLKFGVAVMIFLGISEIRKPIGFVCRSISIFHDCKIF
jgi:hypothetical protein